LEGEVGRVPERERKEFDDAPIRGTARSLDRSQRSRWVEELESRGAQVGTNKQAWTREEKGSMNLSREKKKGGPAGCGRKKQPGRNGHQRSDGHRKKKGGGEFEPRHKKKRPRGPSSKDKTPDVKERAKERCRTWAKTGGGLRREPATGQASNLGGEGGFCCTGFWSHGHPRGEKRKKKTPKACAR